MEWRVESEEFLAVSLVARLVSVDMPRNGYRRRGLFILVFHSRSTALRPQPPLTFAHTYTLSLSIFKKSSLLLP